MIGRRPYSLLGARPYRTAGLVAIDVTTQSLTTLSLQEDDLLLVFIGSASATTPSMSTSGYTLEGSAYEFIDVWRAGGRLYWQVCGASPPSSFTLDSEAKVVAVQAIRGANTTTPINQSTVDVDAGTNQGYSADVSSMVNSNTGFQAVAAFGFLRSANSVNGVLSEAPDLPASSLLFADDGGNAGSVGAGFKNTQAPGTVSLGPVFRSTADPFTDGANVGAAVIINGA